MKQQNRRQFLQHLGMLPLIAGMAPIVSTLAGCGNGSSSSQSSSQADTAAAADTLAKAASPVDEGLFFKVSLAEWSFNHSLFAGKMNNLDFPLKAKNDFGITAVEYVNQFFIDKAKDKDYLKQLKQRCDDNGIASVRIMCDSEGDLGNTTEKERLKAVENHYKWVEAAQFLGCTDIRVNARGQGTPGAVSAAAVKSLIRLSDFAKDYNLAVIVENHGEYSSDGRWIAGVMKAVNHPNCGLLPDWGNFCLKEDKSGKCLQEYDRYKGITEMMPYAKGVSAKSYAFDPSTGEDTTIDFKRMLQIARDAGFHQYVGIEFEGPDEASEDSGVRSTLKLLQKYGKA